MTIRPPLLFATLVATAIALSGCGSSSEPEPAGAPVIESSIIPEDSEVEEPEVEEPGQDETSEGDPEGPGGLDEDGDVGNETDPALDPEGAEGEEPVKPVVPTVGPDQVALSFQRALFAGDGATACAQLTKDAEQRLVRQGVAKGMIGPRQNCNNYAVVVGNSYANWDVSMKAFAVDQKPRRSSARIEMHLNDEPSQVRMELVLAGSEWKISQWGSH